MNFLSASEPFAVSALIILLGYTLKKLKILNENDGKTLAKVALNITLPAITLINIPKAVITPENLILPLTGLPVTAAVTLTAAYIFRKKDPAVKGLLIIASSGFNIGLFAIPIISGVYGEAGVTGFALFDIGNAFAMFGFLWYLAGRFSPLENIENSGRGINNIFKMLVTSIPFMAYIAGLCMNFAGFQFSGFFLDVLKVPAAMNRGTSLLVLGILLNIKTNRETLSRILPPLAIRYSAGIILALFFLYAFKGLTAETRILLAAAVVMPPPLSLIPFSVKWGYSEKDAAAIVNTGIPVSFILFWGIILLSGTAG
jgi:predicted permease